MSLKESVEHNDSISHLLPSTGVARFEMTSVCETVFFLRIRLQGSLN